jgi:hypothetical protein
MDMNMNMNMDMDNGHEMNTGHEHGDGNYERPNRILDFLKNKPLKFKSVHFSKS